MSIISLPFTFSAGAVIIASQHNSNFSTIYNDYNGNITNENIAGGAAIDYSKLNLTGDIQTSDLSSSLVVPGSKVDLTSPGAIGSGTPNTGAFTTLKVGTTNQGDILYDNGTSLVRLTPSTAGRALITAGPSANPFWGSSNIPLNVQIFTSGTSTWTKPSGINRVYIRIWGAGGGGTSTAGTATAGGSSSFAGSTTISATGGTAAASTTPGSGGTGSNGQINLTGGDGSFTNNTISGLDSGGGVPLMGIGFPGLSTGTALNYIIKKFGYAYGGFGSSTRSGGGAGGYSEGYTDVTGDVTVIVGAGGAGASSGGTGGDGLCIVMY